MTYAAARAQIVKLVQSARPTLNPEGFAPSFVEFPDGDDTTNPPPTRGFTIFTISDDVRKGLVSRRRRQARIQLEIYYRLIRDRTTLDLVLRADHKAVGDALLDISQWDQANSGMLTIEDGSGILILHADVNVRPKLIAHVYRFDLEYLSA